MVKRKQLTALCFAWLLTTGTLYAQDILRKPARKDAVVAVIADAEMASQPALDRYCRMLEQKEGLGVYAVASVWKNPGEVRAFIAQISKEYPTLEGLVLVGNIPVALIRNAQHMTTAFKMDEIKFDRTRSSVASDRFYDDPALQFRQAGRDSIHTNWFYYELEETGPQQPQSRYYTGRIMSHAPGAKRLAEINAFLDKAVAARETPNPLDHMLAFTGGAYNSESLIAWLHEQKALQEVLPAVFQTSDGYRPLHFSMNPKMKYRLFSELQRPGLDLALLTEHGDIEKQYINNPPAGDNADFSVRYLQYYLRTSLRRAAGRGSDPGQVRQELMKRFDLPASWLEGALDNPELRKTDSLFLAETDIVSADLPHISPTARMILFNACYNGSFHHPDNISAGYLFGNGQTLVTHGNTTNVLQDKWTIEHIGLLSKGLRAGQWSRLNNTLESSLNGDPTYRFAATPSSLNKLVAQPQATSVWESLMTGNDPALQALAMRFLFLQSRAKQSAAGPGSSIGPGSSAWLRGWYEKSPYHTVRMEALKLLSQTGDSNYAVVAVRALQDPYELIRRKSAEWMARAGNETFIRPLLETLLLFPDDARLVYNIHRCLEVMPYEKVESAWKELAPARAHFYDAPKLDEQIAATVARSKKNTTEAIAEILDPSVKEDKRIQSVRLLRNYNYHHKVPELLPLLNDKDAPVEIKKNLVEALGWFSLSYQKNNIIAACRQLAGSDAPAVLKAEAEQTMRRLQQWTLH